VLSDPAATVKDAAFTQIRRGEKPGYSIRTAEYRYTLWNDGADGEQLYDMQSDPGETTNLAAKPEYADVVAKLKERVRAYAPK
jgi:iduronate 2-sulfatase